MSGDLIQSIGRFEDGDEGGGLPWLGGPRGVVTGLLLTLGAAVLLALSVVAMFAIGEHIVSKLICAFMLIVVAAVTAYWRRQRLAAHYEAAQRLVESADPDKRQSGFTELMVNARRGRAEHRRIAATLTAYLRRPPHDQPNETGRRQLVLTLLADFTLSPLAKERLDLSGASLVGLRAVNAELPRRLPARRRSEQRQVHPRQPRVRGSRRRAPRGRGLHGRAPGRHDPRALGAGPALRGRRARGERRAHISEIAAHPRFARERREHISKNSRTPALRAGAARAHLKNSRTPALRAGAASDGRPGRGCARVRAPRPSRRGRRPPSPRSAASCRPAGGWRRW